MHHEHSGRQRNSEASVARSTVTKRADDSSIADGHGLMISGESYLASGTLFRYEGGTHWLASQSFCVSTTEALLLIYEEPKIHAFRVWTC
jgi:hypothetical protein